MYTVYAMPLVEHMFLRIGMLKIYGVYIFLGKLTYDTSYHTSFLCLFKKSFAPKLKLSHNLLTLIQSKTYMVFISVEHKCTIAY